MNEHPDHPEHPGTHRSQDRPIHPGRPDHHEHRGGHRHDTDGLPTLVEVAAVRDVSASMRRVRFAGEGVADYLRAPRIPNIKLLFPHEGASPDLPTRSADHHYDFAPGQRERVRTYTVRDYDVEAATLDVDFVRHGREGLASAWVEDARPGDRLGALGGGGRLPGPCSWILLVADDTGLPGASAILEQLPADQVGVALLEVDGPADEQELAHPAGVEVRWLHRSGTPAAFSGLLTQAARGGLTKVPVALDDVFVWVSAESHVVRRLRREVRALGVPRSGQLVIGYWHAGSTETSYAVAADHDRVRDESSVQLPGGAALTRDALAHLFAGVEQ